MLGYKVLKTNINETAFISSDYVTAKHPLNDLLGFREIREFMEGLEREFLQFENLRFVKTYDYHKSEGTRYGVTREWYDLVGDHKTELLENLD